MWHHHLGAWLQELQDSNHDKVTPLLEGSWWVGVVTESLSEGVVDGVGVACLLQFSIRVMTRSSSPCTIPSGERRGEG